MLLRLKVKKIVQIILCLIKGPIMITSISILYMNARQETKPGFGSYLAVNLEKFQNVPRNLFCWPFNSFDLYGIYPV